jgi:integral membrane protein (TIGR00529 family)
MLNLIGVIVGFSIVIILIRKKINFGLSLILGAIIVGIFSLGDIEPIMIPRAFIQALFYSFETNKVDTGTIELAILMTLIFVLARSMQETGGISRLIDSLRSIFSRGGALAVIPAVYGLMPVPGGSLFSAPTIDQEGNKYNLDKNQKNFVNVWFRHIWFSIYPISSAMILITSAKFANFDILLLILANIPAFIASIFIGLVYLKRFIRNSPGKNRIDRKRDKSGLVYIIPPVLPVVIYGFLQIFHLSEVRSFIIGVILSIILVFYLTKKTREEYLHILKKSLTINLVLAIFGIMIFREMFETSQSNIVLRDIFVNSNISILLLVVIIPLLLGVLTGYNLGSVALSFPILAPLFPLDIGFFTLVGYTSLIFISSIIGYLISPIHLCNVLSSDYLKTDTTRMYKMYIPAALSVLVVQTTVIWAVITILG